MEWRDKSQEKAVIDALTAIVTKHSYHADTASIEAITAFIGQIKQDRERERWNVHCNTDCPSYKRGTCPFKHNEHYKCVYYRDMVFA